jgi:ankyrin repeat protein
MKMIIDDKVPDEDILSCLVGLSTSNEIRAQEFSLGCDICSKIGSLLHACAVAGRIAIAKQLILYGADVKSLNYNNQSPMDLAVVYGKMEMSRFLSPTDSAASIELEPMYARDERNLIWTQRRRRRNRMRQVESARLTLDEEDGAIIALAEEEREEWFQLEGSYLKMGLALETINRFKTFRRMS